VRIETPCISECLLEQGICISCFRTRNEIASWTKMTVEQRKEIMESLPTRRNREKDLKSQD